MSDHYYENKKAHFKSNFGIEWNENLSDYLRYINIEITREFMDNVSDLKESVDKLSGALYDTKG